MKPENKALIKSLLDQSDSLQEDIYADTEQMLGTVPFILRIMARRPEFMIFSALKDFYALRPKSFDARTAELLAVASGLAGLAALYVAKCLNALSKRARRKDRSYLRFFPVCFGQV